jgi:hypothetical protein
MTFDFQIFQHHLKSGLTFTANIEPGLKPAGSKSAVARPKKELICPILQQKPKFTSSRLQLLCGPQCNCFPLFLVKYKIIELLKSFALQASLPLESPATCSPVSSLLDHWTQLSHQLDCLTQQEHVYKRAPEITWKPIHPEADPLNCRHQMVEYATWSIISRRKHMTPTRIWPRLL